MTRLVLTLALAIGIGVMLPSAADAQQLKRELVKCIQQGLLDAGHDPNGVDGGIGPGTMNAAKSWQEANLSNQLGELTREATPSELRDWCFVVDSDDVHILFGELFQLIVMQDGSGYRVSDVGPAYLQIHGGTSWMRLVSVFRGFEFENNVTPVNLTRSQRAFLDDLPQATEVEVMGSTTRIEPSFFENFGEAEQIVGDRNGRTFAVSEDGGIYRIIIYNDDHPEQLIVAATAEAWGDEIEGAADWPTLTQAFAIEKPQPGQVPTVLATIGN